VRTVISNNSLLPRRALVCKIGTNVDGHEFQRVTLKSSLPYFRIDALEWTFLISRLGELKEALL
jgi:hypothetical protein